jgi:hypothetical protein
MNDPKKDVGSLLRMAEIELSTMPPVHGSAGQAWGITRSLELVREAIGELSPNNIPAVDDPSEEDTISDGFGSVWSAICPQCHERTIEIVRPGKVQCTNCG